MCIKVQNPVVVKPKFKEYCIYGSDLARKYLDLGVRMPFPRSDNWYYHTDREGWAKLVEHLVIKSSLYKKDKRDCDWYARKAYVMCCELVCVICGTILIVNGIDSTVGVILLIIVAGYLGLDLSPWIPWGKNQRKKKDHDCSDEEV